MSLDAALTNVQKSVPDCVAAGFVDMKSGMLIGVKTVDSPTVRVCFDTGHANCVGRPVKMWREARSFIITMHVHDNDGNADAIRKQLIEGVELAKHLGYAILIGHVYNPAIITVLEEIYPTLESQGVRVTFLSELL